MKKQIFSLFTIMLLFGKTNGQINSSIDTSKTEVLRLDLKSARGVPVSKVFDEVKFIPLETTTQSLFGAISQLEVAKDCYIITDQDTRCVLIFNLDGTFRNKIKMERTTPAYPIGLKLIQNSNDEQIQVVNGKYISLFDLTGKLLSKQETKLIDDGKTEFYFKKEDIIIKTNLEISKKEYEVVLLKNGKELARYFPHQKDYSLNDQFVGGGKNLTSSGVQDEVFYKRFYDYSIYKITPKGASLDYKFVFPIEYSLPNDFMTNKDFINKRIDFIQNNRKMFYGISNIYKLGNNLFFSGACMDLSKSYKRDFIYNVKNRSLIALADIEPDALSFYLPVTNLGLNPDFSFHGFHLCKDGYLYNSIPSIDMKILKNQNPNKNIQYDQTLTNYFKTASKLSNPVLVIIKPKKD